NVYAWGSPTGISGVSRPPCAQPYTPTPCIDLPQLVLTSTGLTAIGAGESHSHAVINGQVQSWGWNMSGELGDGTLINRSSPVPVPTLSGVQAIAGGMYHTLALMNDGTVQAWGDAGAIGFSCPG